jgi:hypothetical protein
MIHGGAAMVAFLSFPVAALLLSRRMAAVNQIPRTRFLVPLAVACAAALMVFFVCLTPVFSNRPPYLLGLVERILLGLYAAWLIAVSASVASATVPGRHA